MFLQVQMENIGHFDRKNYSRLEADNSVCVDEKSQITFCALRSSSLSRLLACSRTSSIETLRLLKTSSSSLPKQQILISYIIGKVIIHIRKLIITLIHSQPRKSTVSITCPWERVVRPETSHLNPGFFIVNDNGETQKSLMFFHEVVHEFGVSVIKSIQLLNLRLSMF